MKEVRYMPRKQQTMPQLTTQQPQGNDFFLQ